MVRVVVTKGVPVTDEEGRHVCYVHPDTVRELVKRKVGVVPTVLTEAVDAAAVERQKRRNRTA